MKSKRMAVNEESVGSGRGPMESRGKPSSHRILRLIAAGLTHALGLHYLDLQSSPAYEIQEDIKGYQLGKPRVHNQNYPESDICITELEDPRLHLEGPEVPR